MRVAARAVAGRREKMGKAFSVRSVKRRMECALLENGLSMWRADDSS